MKIQPIKTKKFYPPKDYVLSEILNNVSRLPENSILAISAKVVSIDQGRCVTIADHDKDELII